MGLVDSGAVSGDALAHQRLSHPIWESGVSYCAFIARL